MATVKSKLKEALQQEKDKATNTLLRCNTPEELEISRTWLESIKRIEKVCDDRKRY